MISNDSIIVVDVSFPSSAKNILTFVRRTLGRDIKDIKLVVLTHSHIDHVNGVDYIVDSTGAAIAAHVNAEKYLTGKRPIPIPPWDELKEFFSFLAEHNFPRPSISDAFSMPWAGIPFVAKGIRSKVTYWLGDGERLPNHPEWQVVYTPGHTDDSICLYSSLRKSLLSGDTIVNLRGHLTLNPLLTLNNEALLKSLDKLRQLHIDNVYPGWGMPVFGKNVLDRVASD